MCVALISQKQSQMCSPHMVWNLPYAFSRPFWLSRLEKHLVVLWDDSCSAAEQLGVTTAPCRSLGAAGTARKPGGCKAEQEQARAHTDSSHAKGNTKTKWQKIPPPPWNKNNKQTNQTKPTKWTKPNKKTTKHKTKITQTTEVCLCC